VTTTNDDDQDQPTGVANDADATAVVPPAAVARPEHAWSNEEPPTEALSRPWRSVWAIAGIGVLCAVVVALAIFGVVALVRENHGAAQSAPTTPAHSAASASAPVAPAAPRAANPDDDEFVAVAISPGALGTAHHSGYGHAGTQEKADQIALSECKATSGNDDCLTINAGMFQGCVSYAIDSSQRKWASGSGPDPDAARADALRRLGLPAHSSYVQCSDPPGEIRAPESAPAAAPAPPAGAEAPQPSVQADHTYITLASQIPGVVILDQARFLGSS
jgi:hypothetical protein